MVVAGIVGSFAYNVTMTLEAAALIRPLSIVDATLLHKPAIAMLLALVLVIVIATPKQQISQRSVWFLVVAYPMWYNGKDGDGARRNRLAFVRTFATHEANGSYCSGLWREG